MLGVMCVLRPIKQTWSFSTGDELFALHCSPLEELYHQMVGTAVRCGVQKPKITGCKHDTDTWPV